MKRRVAARQDRVPFLHDKLIEEQAQLLLDEWAEEHTAITTPPVPIESILELHLQLELELADLQTELGHPDILGGIWFGTRTIKVDQSLDPKLNPMMLGRYRFTLAHEVGHWRLHRKYFLTDSTQLPLGASEGPPDFVWRSTGQNPEEVQANRFAGFLLMPRHLLRPAWADWRGRDDVVCVLDLDVPHFSNDAKHNQDIAMQRFCKPLAERFHVSAEAMAYRLEALGRLTRDRSLFG